MGAGYTCMKCLFVILNIIFLLFAIAGIGAAIWMFVDPTIPLHFTQESQDYLISTVIILLASIILLIVALLGIYSVSKEVRKALVASCCLLLIIVVAEVAAGVWGYINRYSLDLYIRTSVIKTVGQDYHEDENVRNLFDTIQSKMQCCGYEGPRDWIKRNKELDLGVSSKSALYNIPESCCLPNVKPEDCEAATHMKVGSELDDDIIYERGCYSYIMDKLHDNVQVILVVGGIILAVQVLGLVLGLILACSMNRSHRYKA